MASGKAKYIAGLHDLVGGFTLMEQRRHQRMLENLEKAKFEYEKARDEALDAAEIQDRREARILGIREKQFDRMIDMGKLRQNEQADRRRLIMGSGNNARDTMLALGNLRAREGALDLSKQREARLATPDVPTSSGGTVSGGKLSGLDKARQIRSDVATLAGEIAAEKPKSLSLEGILKQNRFFPTSPSDYAGPSPKRFEPEATKYVPGAGDLPMPKTSAPDAYEAMSEEEWLTAVNSAVSDALGRPVTEEEIATRPEMQLYVYADPSHRRRLFADIPRMFIRESAP